MSLMIINGQQFFMPSSPQTTAQGGKRNSSEERGQRPKSRRWKLETRNQRWLTVPDEAYRLLVTTRSISQYSGWLYRLVWGAAVSYRIRTKDPITLSCPTPRLEHLGTGATEMENPDG